MNEWIKGILYLIGIIIIIFFVRELGVNMGYDQYESDCKEGESFSPQSFITGVGNCIKSADAVFCERVQRCTQNEIKDCYPCIMLLCEMENNQVMNQGCYTNKTFAEEIYYDSFQYSSGCINTSIDYDFLDGQELCYKNGELINEWYNIKS